MKIKLQPGDKLIVEFDETDGQMEVHFDTPQHPSAIVVKETAGLEGNKAGAANAILYEEDFHLSPDEQFIAKIVHGPDA